MVARDTGGDGGALGRVAREGILIGGGARAILLQVAHPAIARGVAEHSDFARHPMDRLHATLRYVYAISLGTPEQAAWVADTVNAAHRSVRGPGYRADDPALQLWVGATLYDTAMLIYQRIFGPLPGDVADAAYRQYARLATALRMPPEMWPPDRAAFADYWQHMLDTVRVGDDARRAAHDLLHPTTVPRAVRAAMPLNRFLTAAWLPPRLRAAYGLRWDALRQRRYEALMTLTAISYPRVPGWLREAPARSYLRRLHRRMEAERAHRT